MWYIILLLFAHFMADFVFQSHEVGNKKHNSNSALFEHCCFYTWWLFVILFWISYYFGLSPYMFSIFVFINGIFHFAVDWVTSRVAYFFHRRITGEKKFWITIGADQFIHAAALIISAYYLLGFKI